MIKPLSISYVIAVFFMINFACASVIDTRTSESYPGSARYGSRDNGSYYLLNEEILVEVSKDIWNKVFSVEIYIFFSGALGILSMVYIFLSRVYFGMKRRTRWMDR